MSQTSSVPAPEQRSSAPAAPPAARADDLFVVDCLLPGQVRKLGRMSFLTPRRPVKTAAQDCEIKGGEYVAYDRADYRTALNVWLPQAQEGDQKAQTYVGEIFEKGLGVQPDYALAVEWYRKAAEQGYTRAQINLGYLYEKGLGVPKDPEAALHWYRKAAGLSAAITMAPGSTITPQSTELEALRQEVEHRKRESDALRQQLEQTRQQLAQTQRQLARRESAAETERHQLEKARQDLQRQKQLAAASQDDAGLKRLEEQLKQREAALERSRQEITQLRQATNQLEAEAEGNRKRIEELSAPTIELSEPPPVTHDGIPSVKTRPGKERVIEGRVTAPAGLQTFTINDHPEPLDAKGAFRVRIPVQRSSIRVTMVAIDKQGKHTTAEFMLVPEKPLRLASLSFGNYYALIIGNRAYTYWPKLDTPENDANKVDEMLSTKYGFKTTVLRNATRYEILKALHELQKKLTERDNLLIYYAGHGHLADKDRGYWVPIDGEKDSRTNWIANLNITDILNTISAEHVLVVADTCYAGALTQSSVAQLAADISDEDQDKQLKDISEKRSRTALTSGSIKPVNIAGGSHSLFAKAFLDVLRENDEILTGLRLYQKVSARVVQAAVDQSPQYAPIQFAGHEAGDFILVPAAMARAELNQQRVGKVVYLSKADN
jgi:hypothetical protein